MTATPAELSEFTSWLERDGLHGGLRFLNGRTPHRFTGVYRYDGATLRNVALYDRFESHIRHGVDVPLANAYCSNLGHKRRSLTFNNIHTATDVSAIPESPVISYCGVLIYTPQGTFFGALCHFDLQPCQERVSDLPLLEACAPLIYSTVCKSATLAQSRDARVG